LECAILLLPLFKWMESLRPPFPLERPDMPPATVWGFLWHYSRPFWPLLLASATLSIIVASIEVSLFGFMGRLVDWLSQADRATFWEEHGALLTWMGALVLILLPLLKLFFESLSHTALLGNFAMRTRWQAHRYVLRQSVEFFQNDFAGRIATKVMQTALAVRDVVMTALEVVLYVVAYFTGAVVLFASSDLRLSFPLLIWLAAYITTLYHFIPKLKRLSAAQADARSMVTGRIVDAYTNITTVKMFAHADREDRYAKDGMTIFMDSVYAQMRMVTRLTIVLNTMNSTLLLTVAALSIWLWHLGAVTTGAIALAVGLVMRLQGMAHWILWEISSVFENIGVVQDGIETVAREREVADSPDARPLRVTRGEIRYERICFNYGKHRSEEGRGVIDGLSLTFKAGEKVGIVGRSGAGKSTLASLLLRFYDLEGGRILIDGQDIAEVSQDSLRSQIGMVTQDTSLLHRSVMDNILYGKPDASREEAVAAARKSHAHEFIVGLEDLNGRRGYEAHVGERGVKLSGGQRQRVAIARVLLKNAPILVLDEATSALDSEVEQAIQESLYDLMEGKTVIAIAHRLSTIAAMDRLVVMDEGRLIEEGTHHELLRRGGLYADLWARQSGGFLALRTAAE
jgi:ATP-binding cassette subfamily B multidrug efflux pump